MSDTNVAKALRALNRAGLVFNKLTPAPEPGGEYSARTTVRLEHHNNELEAIKLCIAEARAALVAETEKQHV